MNYFLMLIAQEMPDVPVGDLLPELLKFIGGIKGAGALAIAAGSVQLAMMFFKTSLANFAGKYKLLIVYGLTVVAGVLSGMTVGGMSLVSALFHANTLAALQVFGHQIYKQFIEKK